MGKETDIAERMVSALERIADALGQELVIQNLRLEDQVTFTEMIRGTLDDLEDVLPPPPTVGDVVCETDDVMTGPPEVFGPDDPYDPSDDTTCPNCSQGEGVPVVDHGGPTGALMCDQCHHVWVPGVE